MLGGSSLKGPLPKGVYSLTLAFTNDSSSQELVIKISGGGSGTQPPESKLVRVVSAIVNR